MARTAAECLERVEYILDRADFYGGSAGMVRARAEVAAVWLDLAQFRQLHGDPGQQDFYSQHVVEGEKAWKP